MNRPGSGGGLCDRWSFRGGRIFLKTALPPQEIIRRLQAEIDGPEPVTGRPLSGVLGTAAEPPLASCLME